MKLLVVAMSNSVHTARWLSQIADQGWDIHLYPSYDVGQLHPGLQNITVHQNYITHPVNHSNNVIQVGKDVRFEPLAFVLRLVTRKFFPKYYAIMLAKLIKEISPDLIHSLEMQGAGYLTLEAKKLLQGKFPKWIVTSWGSDMYYFGRFADHAKKINHLLTSCNYYHGECQRDVILAKKFGLTGTSLPVLPDSGGFDIKKIAKLRSDIKPSKRKNIMVKGYQGWAGRALTTLKALEECIEEIRGYRIIIYSSNLAVRIAAKKFYKKFHVPILIVPPKTKHDQMMSYFGQSRIAIGIGISDGISTMVLEAMAMGTFPIQSNTSCANEWIDNKKTGFLVPPDNISAIAAAIKKALSDDKLVNEASVLNYETVVKRLDQSKLNDEVVSIYKQIYEEKWK